MICVWMSKWIEDGSTLLFRERIRKKSKLWKQSQSIGEVIRQYLKMENLSHKMDWLDRYFMCTIYLI